ncbi:hypothetical protein [Pontixanthobacter sp.]|uniref:hypothetical protein n=1 Tax=Pontixanthobacter sp. TaxID=2792078 RepID=UPI003C7D85A0
MKRTVLISAAALALGSSLAMAQSSPESLLPPGFDDPAPTATPPATRQQPAPRQPPAPRQQPAPSQTRAPAPNISVPSAPTAPSGSTSVPAVQPVPSGPAPDARSTGPVAGVPSIADLEKLNPDELDELLGLKPKFDMPASAQRSMERVGLLGTGEGGLAAGALRNQSATLVRAALTGMKGPVVSRWGHIMARRALASRLEAPSGMDPADFVALRARALNAMSEHGVTRALAQDVDTGNWSEALTDAAIEAYLATSDIVGACPIVQMKGGERDDPEWVMLQSICYAFLGQGSRAQANLNRAFRNKIAPEIDVLLAQRFAGAAGRGRRAINLEWEGVEELTPWRFGLATAVGAELPAELLGNAPRYFQQAAAQNPALSLTERMAGVDMSAEQGVLSSSAAVAFYSEILARGGAAAEPTSVAADLRQAYVAVEPAARLAAMRTLWGEGQADYARQVLTAYAAARMPPSEALASDAADLIASMLTAGLDADALTWAPFAPQGSEAWALLVLAQPNRNSPVTTGQFDGFMSADESKDARASKMFLAGLAGLGRIGQSDALELADDLSISLNRQSKWSQLISQAAEVNNAPLVAFLAATGMQGDDWSDMTPRHVYFIVAALNQAGLSAEARMIAAEAVARS